MDSLNLQPGHGYGCRAAWNMTSQDLTSQSITSSSEIPCPSKPFLFLCEVLHKTWGQPASRTYFSHLDSPVGLNESWQSVLKLIKKGENIQVYKWSRHIISRYSTGQLVDDFWMPNCPPEARITAVATATPPNAAQVHLHGSPWMQNVESIISVWDFMMTKIQTLHFHIRILLQPLSQVKNSYISQVLAKVTSIFSPCLSPVMGIPGSCL